MPYHQVIHIGANKSASTTLQRALFAKDPSIKYLGEDCQEYTKYRPLLQNLVYEDDFNYDRIPLEDLFSSYDALARKTDSLFLYSNEDIMTSRVPSQVLSRLHSLMPDARILLIIRNQLEAIPSWYANHGAFLKGVPREFWRRYVSADEFMNHSINFFNYGPLDCFMYYKIISKYAQTFGKDRISILFFEDFVQNKKLFVEQLSEVLRIDKNKAFELLQEKAERQRISQRRFIWHKLSRSIPFIHESKIPSSLSKAISPFLDSGPKAKSLGIENWQEKLVDIYKADNQKLQDEFKINLSKFNYPLMR